MYALKYYWEKNLNGDRIRLEIYKKDSTAAAMEIGDVVQGLSLNVDGGEDNLDAPIVSTSLVMTFADKYDHPDAGVKKYGNWAEFYTPDATMWKVILSCNGSPAWGGYVTPDSYEEDLVYGGSVTIVARDNIGHLNDFPFDAQANDYGMVSFRDLIEDAWAKIESPMSLLWADEWLMCGEVSAIDTYINASALEKKNWYEAIESILYSYGAVLRYKGGNEYIVCPLASLPDIGEDYGIAVEPVFMTGATRMLTPAVKRIEESVQYDLTAEEQQRRLAETDYTGTTMYYTCEIEGLEIDGTKIGTLAHQAPVWSINGNTAGWANNDPSKTLFFNHDAYELGYFTDYMGQGEEVRSPMYIAANNTDSRNVSFYKFMNSSDFSIKMKFGRPVRLDTTNKLEIQDAFNLNRILYAVSREVNGITEYYQGYGDWRETYKVLEEKYDPNVASYDFSAEIKVGSTGGNIEYAFHIVKIEYMQVGAGVGKVGLYAALQLLTFSVPEGGSLLATNNVNTNFSVQNNVVISRDPVFAPAMNEVALAAFIKNGIFTKQGNSYKPARKWSWQNGSPQQMAVYTHLQILPYYAKPNNILEGNIVNADVTQFGNRWVWEGKNHLLVAGRFNMLTGYIEGAILREYLRYDDLWANIPEVERPSVQTSSRTNAETTGTGSGSQPTSYTNTTNVTIGLGGTGEGGAAYLKDLLDVDVTGVSGGSVLYFDGSQWTDRSLTEWMEDLLKKSAYLASLWQVDSLTGEMYTTHKVHIKNDMYADGEVSSGEFGEEGEGMLIDSAMSSTSQNAVQNRVIKAYVDDSIAALTTGLKNHPANYIGLKTINGQSLFGSGDITIKAGTSGSLVHYYPTITKGKTIGAINIDGMNHYLYAPASYAWGDITGKPTNVADSGLTDAVTTNGKGATGTWDIHIKGNSSYATTAGSAETAARATSAEKADTATKATNADSATKAGTADLATKALSADSATTAESAAKLKDKKTIFGREFNGTQNVEGEGVFTSIKIGDATITWDAEKNSLKVDKYIYSIEDVAAGGN